MVGREGGDVFGRFATIARINAILFASWFCRVKTCLNQVFAFWLSDERLQFGSGECVNKASLGDDQEQDLSASEDREFVCLLHNTSLSLGEGDVSS